MVAVLTRVATRPQRIRVAAFAGHVIEWYEFSVYGVLAAYLSGAVFPQVAHTTSLALTWATFAVAFVVRPLGGVVLAGLADRTGRRAALLVTVVLMTVATAGIGMTPDYTRVGLLAPVLFIALRMLQGFAVGGEMSSAVPYFSESLPPDRRAVRAMGLLATGPWIAALTGALLAAALAARLSHEQMQAWGWRIPFLIALPLGLGVLLLRVAAPESAAFESMVADRVRSDRPFRTALRTSGRQIMAFGVLALLFNVAIAVCLTGITSEALMAGLPARQVLWISVTAYVAYIAAIIAMTRIVEVVPRRVVVGAGAAALLVTVLPAVALARSGHLWPALIACVGLAIPVGLLATPTYLAMRDLFPPAVRASASGIAFNVATAISAMVPASTLAVRDLWGFGGGLAVWATAAALPVMILAVYAREGVFGVDR